MSAGCQVTTVEITAIVVDTESSISARSVEDHDQQRRTTSPVYRSTPPLMLSSRATPPEPSMHEEPITNEPEDIDMTPPSSPLSDPPSPAVSVVDDLLSQNPLSDDIAHASELIPPPSEQTTQKSPSPKSEPAALAGRDDTETRDLQSALNHVDSEESDNVAHSPKPERKFVSDRLLTSSRPHALYPSSGSPGSPASSSRSPSPRIIKPSSDDHLKSRDKKVQSSKPIRQRKRLPSSDEEDELSSKDEEEDQLVSSDDEKEVASRAQRAKSARGKARGKRLVKSDNQVTSLTSAERKGSTPEIDLENEVPVPASAHQSDRADAVSEQSDEEDAIPQKPRKVPAKRRAPPASLPGSRSPSPTSSRHSNKRAKTAAPKRSRSVKPAKVEFVDWDEIAPLPVSELEGMIIETLATSRATSMSAPSIYEALLRTRPALKTMSRKVPPPAPTPSDGDEMAVDDKDEDEPDTSSLNKREWVQLLTYILTAGNLTSGVFGRVDSSASDSDDLASPTRTKKGSSSHKGHEPLSKVAMYTLSRSKSSQRAQWFYVPARDPDADRANLVKTMMRGPGKRSETMKYKRYYWKPLGKISRWDREDDL